MYGICHAERFHIVVQRVEIAVAHQPRSTGQRLFKAVADNGHPGIVVIGFIGVLIICRIPQDHAVFVKSKRAVRNGGVVRIIATRQEFIPVGQAGRGCVIVAVSHKGTVVYPEILTRTEVYHNGVIAVGLGIVL